MVSFCYQKPYYPRTNWLGDNNYYSFRARCEALLLADTRFNRTILAVGDHSSFEVEDSLK